MASLLRNVLRVNQSRGILSARLLSRNVINCEKAAAVPSRTPAEEDGKLSGKTHRVNNFEKRILVWTGKYKSMAEVPAWVT